MTQKQKQKDLIQRVHQLGITVRDEDRFVQEIRYYGFNEIFSQYLPCFSQKQTADSIQLQRSVDFSDIDALYHLDQRLKNIMMISLQQFEQTFKVALVNAVTDSPELDNLFHESYTLADGHIIRRGELKARIRHIKRNYLEPYPGYNQKHHHKITPWILIKEMSFGVATNAFFLLPVIQQEQILKQIFQKQPDLLDLETLLAHFRLFRGRAAHNYRLINIQVDHQPLYDLVLTDLTGLVNPEPYQKAVNRIKTVTLQSRKDYPGFDEVIKANFNHLQFD